MAGVLIGLTVLAACGPATSGAQAPATQPTTAVTVTTTSSQWTTTVVAPPPTTTAPVPAKVYAALCTITKQPAPTQLALACTGSNQLRQATWSTWNYDHADGTGVLALNNCQPDCVTGTGVDYPVSVHFDTPGQTKCGTIWERAVFTYLNAPPKGAALTYHNGKATFTLTTNPATVVGC
jgi:hypothetical protein